MRPLTLVALAGIALLCLLALAGFYLAYAALWPYRVWLLALLLVPLGTALWDRLAARRR